MPVSEECVQSENRDKETVETSPYTGEEGMHRGALTELERAPRKQCCPNQEKQGEEYPQH